MSNARFRNGPNDRRTVLLLIAGVVAVVGAVYLGAFVASGDKVPRGTTVDGIDIGGRSPEAARTLLDGELAERTPDRMVATAGDTQVRIDPTKAGLSVDIDATVAQAGGGRSWNPARIWDYFTDGDDLEPVVDVDADALSTTVARVARRVDTEAKEGKVGFGGGAVSVRYPAPGLAVDTEGAADALVAAYPASAEVELPVEEVAPKVGEKQVRAAVEEFANPAMASAVTLAIDGEEVMLRPADYAAALSLEPEKGTLRPTLDERVLESALAPAIRGVGKPARDATVRLAGGRPEVVPAENGVTVDTGQVAEQLLEVLPLVGDERRVRVETVPAKPEVSTADARALGVRQVVSSFTTNFPHADYRNTNLGRAAEKINGTLLLPGETFSLNDIVGERTAENGFAKGFIIADGVFKEDFGGGVSQVATTTFNAAFFAGLEDVEHKPHSFYIDRYPIGREATVVWGALDLKFKNDTPYGVLVQAGINPSTPSSQGAMTVQMWSTKYWDITTGNSGRYDLTPPKTRYLQGRDCVPNSGYGGFDIDVYRYFRKAGSDELVRKETMHTAYTPSDTVVCGNPPAAR